MYFNKIQISNSKIDKLSFKPALNGTTINSIDDRIYKEYLNSSFFDQDMYFEILYSPKTINNFKEKKYAYPFKELYAQKRILGNMNYYLWQKQILDGGFNFFYGGRIHGNLIALQNNIPAFVKAIDSRTRELAEFFDIPNSVSIPFNEKKDDLFELYKSLDYSKFNETIKQRYNAFKNFLDNNNIPNVLGNNNAYKEYIAKQDYIKTNNTIIFDSNIYKKLPNKPPFYKKLIYRERQENKRIIHFFGIKFSYKKKY